MKSNWLKPNQNGILIFVFSMFVILIVISMFYPATIQSSANLKSEFWITKVFHHYGWVISLILVLLITYPISMRIGLRMPKKTYKNTQSIVPIALLFLLAIPVEIFCTYIAYYTDGDLIVGVWSTLILLNFIFIAIAFKYQTVAAILSSALALLLIPEIFCSCVRYIHIQDEAARIVTYAYEYKLETGNFPRDLSGYTFKYPSLKKHISKYEVDPEEGGIFLAYWINNSTAFHWYSSNRGWGYYPD